MKYLVAYVRKIWLSLWFKYSSLWLNFGSLIGETEYDAGDIYVNIDQYGGRPSGHERNMGRVSRVITRLYWANKSSGIQPIF